MIQASDFGQPFHWGVASSAFQTEGAWDIDGKGPSIWDVFMHQNSNSAIRMQAKMGCDFYNRYFQDLLLMSFLNVPNFRFSISWPRILPQGTGPVNIKGLDFYDRMVDQCLELGITPWANLYHWDLPQALEERGGWCNRDILNWFTDYVERCVQQLGDRVKHWIVLNDPLTFTAAGYYFGKHAPGKRGLSHFLPAMHHAALCQSLGGRIVRALRNDTEVGTSISTACLQPIDQIKYNVEAAGRIDAIMNRWFIEPLLGLGYPLQQFKTLQYLERYIQPEDERILPFEMDFIWLQHYSRKWVHYHPLIPNVQAKISSAHSGKPDTDAKKDEDFAEDLYTMIKRMHEYAGMPPLVVTPYPSTYPSSSTIGSEGDEHRDRLLQRYLYGVLRAKRQGVRIHGFFVRNFLDSFEWTHGNSRRAGLVYTDYANQKRRVKPSGYWYRQFLKDFAVTEAA